jgi:hypothetical protein
MAERRVFNIRWISGPRTEGLSGPPDTSVAYDGREVVVRRLH